MRYDENCYARCTWWIAELIQDKTSNRGGGALWIYMGACMVCTNKRIK